MAEAEYPSIPGRPETYSPTYNKFLDLLLKQEPLTEDEAADVWDAVHALFATIPEGGILSCLYRDLDKELTTGLRCGVCGKYEDSSCVEDC